MPFRLTGEKIQLSENDVERACLGLLRLRGYWVIRVHTGTFRTADAKRWIKAADKGTPDYCAVHERYPGFLLEVKRPGAALSPEQRLKIREIEMGYRLPVVVVESVEEMAAWLAKHEGRSYANQL
jgi:hypothetical protein